MAAGASVLKNENGKRGRNQMDTEDSEFAPLSKRINNLHLHQNQGHSSHRGGSMNGTSHGDHPGCNGTSYNVYNGSGPSGHPSDHERRTNYQPQNHHLGNSETYGSRAAILPNTSLEQNASVPSKVEEHHKTHHGSDSRFSQDDINSMNQREYHPALDANSNPHYYEANKQLYMLYLERMGRTGQNLHPNFYMQQ